jgi:RNase P subunit RPR2
MYPMLSEEHGRPCEKCGTLVPYGSSMTSISAQIHSHLKVSCYFCDDCEGEDSIGLIEIAVENRKKRMEEFKS